MKRRLRVTTVVVWLAPWLFTPVVAVAQVELACPDVRPGQFGPFDYQQQTKYAKELAVVERVHFPPQVENLAHGSSGTLAADLNYTITAFPNHHRALESISRYSIKLNRIFIPGMNCSVDGFFERAARFTPKDAAVRLIYGIHLYRWKKYGRAEEEFHKAEALAPDDANIAYNLGLLYVEMKQWDKAMSYAQKAYAKGYSLPGLKNLLVSAGKWQPPSAQAPATTAGTKKPD